MPLFAAFVILSSVAACGGAYDGAEVAAAGKRQCARIADTPVRLAGGAFLMGEADVYAEEGPVRETRVRGFWLDPHEVTNRQFAAFVAATGHVTVAERPVDPHQFQVYATIGRASGRERGGQNGE